MAGVDLTAIPGLSAAAFSHGCVRPAPRQERSWRLYRRMRAKLGAPKAITATAHKIARLFYAMLATEKPFAELGQQAYEQQYQARRLKGLANAARELGFKLVPATGT